MNLFCQESLVLADLCSTWVYRKKLLPREPEVFYDSLPTAKFFSQGINFSFLSGLVDSPKEGQKVAVHYIGML